ncbi:DUF4249 domain-containing protein [Algibacter sp. 2305UL17-15]|uniref:DUF4249 domain-containing protein n=1 Tax=Algibacter sp. 2305UL17-15 TaxID=3231268 RepID=UPI003457B7DD
MNFKTLYKSVSLLILLVSLGCTEEFPLVTESFEDVLVVEATITDELKTQQIKISRTFDLEAGNSPEFVTNANVRIEASNNNIYNFVSSGSGIYTSANEFKAEQGVAYKLIITTDGKEYESNEEVLAPQAEIEDFYAELITSEEKVGVQVFVDSNDNLGGANYFRYEYEEAYQVIPIFYYPLDLIPVNVQNAETDSISYDLREESRPESERVCYSYNNSNEIILTNTNGLTEQKVSRFPVRFIPANDDRLRDRYSILVKQYVQSADANNFYKVLRDLSSDESLLIDNQPGFIRGNISSSQNEEEKVLGFFDVSSVSSKRIFFNYEDFGLDVPPYFFTCEIIKYNTEITGPPTNERLRLYQFLVNRGYKFFGSEEEDEYSIVRPECGNCSSFASSIKPEFWED